MASATGTASLAVPIALSPGRSGFGPSLSLAYNSGAGNGPFGVGWTLDVPAITRRTDKRLPEYRDSRESDVFVLAGAEDLVPEIEETSPGVWARKVLARGSLRIERFRPRVEGAFARIERRTDTLTSATYWVVTDKNNVTSIFGMSSEGRIAAPDAPSRVFSWLLEATYDDRGNVVRYRYKAEDLDNVSASTHERSRRTGPGVGAQRYPKTIRYGNRSPVRGPDLTLDDFDALGGSDWCFLLVFDYGEHHPTLPTQAEVATWPVRLDPFSSYRAGFELRTYRRCDRVLMFHQFDELGPAPVLVRSTEFTHA